MAERMSRALVAGMSGVAMAVLGATSALADRIDGEWCRESRHFTIEGPNIVTWGGTRMTGDYDRHGFRYTVPANEPEAGTQVEMVLRGEELVDVFRRVDGSSAPPAPESWRRCRVTS